MKKHTILSLLIIVLVTALPVISIAAGPTKAFGGRIVSKTIPTVQCNMPSLNVLNTNIGSIVSTAKSAIGPGNSTLAGAASTAINGYGIIPFYTTNFMKPTQVGQWILGKANLIPEFSNCRINLGQVQIPIPVRDTSNYSTSASRLGF